ncbi:uncharacterized protein involved in exopolysaccharide biosynthesis/Mrp family chromosome partitioning ATPase [Rhizobium sp. BK650]|nr:uncharacterized protein involved in exopolysaccharide biosynthesis/Mrp family chromosome partitioning ATPase [Rhizobium sp. BK650]
MRTMHYEPRFQADTRSDEFDLASGLRLLRRRIVMIICLVALMMTVATVMILGMQPSYHAESRLMIHAPLAKSVSSDDSGNDPLNVASEAERLRSRSVAERVIRDLQLDERSEFNPELRQPSLIAEIKASLRQLIDSGNPPVRPQDRLEPVIEEYYKALQVIRDGPGGVIRIGFDTYDPELAAAVPNRLIEIYLKEREGSARHRLDAAEGWLRQRIAEQQGRTDAARNAADEYQKAMGIVPNDDAQSEQIKSIMELSDRQAKIEQDRVDIKAMIATLEAADDASLATKNDSIPDSINAMELDLRAQQQDLDRLLDIYGSDAQPVVDLRAKIVKSRAELGTAVDRYVQSLRAKLAALDREDGTVRSALATAYSLRSRSTLDKIELARLERVADREQTALDKLEEQRRVFAAQAMLPGAEVEVLSPAAVPLMPQGRGRLFYLIGALVASASIAATAAFAIEMMDKSVRSFDQLVGMGRFIPAGFIPRLKRATRRNPSVLFRHIQGGMFDEAIRTLMISLKQTNGGKLPASIVVTSAHSGEGKSLVAGSLAIELAANGTPVLLVDCDLRRGRLESLFKSGLKRGLNDFMSGQAEIRDIIYRHPSGIDFIPAGKPSNVRQTRLADLAQLIEMAQANGQVVIFDSAPVLASTDTMHLTAIVERTLMVVRWAKTSHRAVDFCLQKLRASSRNPEISIAINGVKPRKHALYTFGDSELYSRSLIKYYNTPI